MSKIIKVVFIVLVVGGFGLIGFAFFAIRNGLYSEKYPTIFKNPRTESGLSDDQKISLSKESRWFNSIANQNTDFAYPATEVDFSVKFLKGDAIQNNDQILIERVNEETLFCIRELLKQEKIDFAYQKKGDDLNLVVFVKNNRREKVLKLFDYYGLSYKK